MKKILILALMLAVLLSSCGTLEVGFEVTETPAPASPFDPLPSATPTPLLSMASTSEDIRQAMLVSATQWQTLFMDGSVLNYDLETNQAYSMRQQVWIDQMNFRFRVLSGPVDGEAAAFRAGNGMTILVIELASGISDVSQMADMYVAQYVPPLEPGTVHGNPLWGQIGEPLAQLAFPSDFAQSQGTFKPIGMETLLGRTTLVVEWTYAQTELPSFRAWLDQQTGLMLKKQNFGKGGGETIETEMTIDQIAFDVALDPALFGAPAETPRFADVHGQALTPLEAAPAVPLGADTLGDLFFFTLPYQADLSPQLVRLPGSCVTGLSACPQLETVPLPFALDFTLHPLSWSMDGKYAAFAYPDHPNGTPQKVFLFDPAANTWTTLAEFPYIDPPFWSPDGTWIAFRTQDGMGGEDVYVVHPDGSGLTNLTASGNLPADARPYIMDGWITENILVHSALPGREGTVYLVRAADQSVRPLFDTLLTKASFIPSPDGAYLAYDEYDYNSQKHVLKVTEPDAANPVELATFTNGTLYPIVWSPDAARVGFVFYTDSANGMSAADVYVVGRDGRNLTQVYKGSTVGRILFSPDGNYLLIEENSTPTGGHLFVVDLTTLQSRILEAPGLSLDTDWFAPSWRR
jgi:hypothetical protein